MLSTKGSFNKSRSNLSENDDFARLSNKCFVKKHSLSRKKGIELHLGSPAFAHSTSIPRTYTCQGRDISPPLSWGDVPTQAKSLALIVDDPDAPDPAAPKRVWVHWVLYNIPVTASGLVEGIKSLPAGTKEGSNDWGRTGYGGPCPPIGRHRYFFKLYAIDAVLPDLKKPNKAALEKAMQGHILDKAELVGTYKKDD